MSWQPAVVHESLFDFKSPIIAVCVGMSVLVAACGKSDNSGGVTIAGKGGLGAG